MAWIEVVTDENEQTVSKTSGGAAPILERANRTNGSYSLGSASSNRRPGADDRKLLSCSAYRSFAVWFPRHTAGSGVQAVGARTVPLTTQCGDCSVAAAAVGAAAAAAASSAAAAAGLAVAVAADSAALPAPVAPPGLASRPGGGGSGVHPAAPLQAQRCPPTARSEHRAGDPRAEQSPGASAEPAQRRVGAQCRPAAIAPTNPSRNQPPDGVCRAPSRRVIDD